MLTPGANLVPQGPTAGGVEVLPLLATGAFLLLGILGAHAATALVLYSPTKLQRRLRAPGLASADPVGHRLDEYLVLARILAILGLGGAILVAPSITAGGPRWPIVAAVGTLLVLCGGVLPVALARRCAESLVLWALPPLRFLRATLRWPLVLPMLGLNRLVVAALRVPKRPTDAGDITEEIVAAVTDLAAETTLEEPQRKWIEKLVQLKGVDVAGMMTPRTDIVAFDAEATLEDVFAEVARSGHSRYPVFEGSIDHVIGVLYTKDVVGRLQQKKSPVPVVRSLVRKVVVVPESMHVDELLEKFRSERVRIAIVLDEYGGTAGLITLEDLLERIVGDLGSEHGAEPGPPIQVIDGGFGVEASGRARVAEVSEAIGVEIPESDEYETIGGYVFSTLGKIPPVGATVDLGGLKIEIVTADDRQITRLRVRVPQPQPQASSTT
jgi:putative hemolysin